MPTPAGDDQDAAATALYVRLLGPFSISCRGREAGPWERPTAKRLCELVFLSPGRRITRQAAFEALFPNLRGDAAAKALYQALSRARSALINLGPPGSELLRADRGSVWADPAVATDVDLAIHEEQLRSALRAQPGAYRDDVLSAALTNDATLLEDEPHAEWVVGPGNGSNGPVRKPALHLRAIAPGALAGPHPRRSPRRGPRAWTMTPPAKKPLARSCGSLRHKRDELKRRRLTPVAEELWKLSGYGRHRPSTRRTPPQR